jgi:carboxyl-terminal processing protease
MAQAAAAESPAPENGWRADARSLPAIISDRYAYPERLPGGRYTLTPLLESEARAVHDSATLLAFTEKALQLLADPHAITGASFADDWAIVPSYSDMRLRCDEGTCTVTDVRAGSPAARAAVPVGARILSLGGVPIAAAIARFWRDAGVETPTVAQIDYAANILAAGRRDRVRHLVLASGDGEHAVTLPNLYAEARPDAPISVSQERGTAVIRFNDSLGDDATIAAFDAAMRALRPNQRLILDLTDTASGGNTVIARAIMGWFVNAPSSYQVHRSPEEERRTGIPRQWVEQVLPRPGIPRHRGAVSVRVGAWTGSMGEGLAVGMRALGADVVGRPMAGLLGAVEDIRLPNSGLVIKLPTERLYAVDMTPREAFRPDPS